MSKGKNWLIREIMKLPCEVKNGYHLVRIADIFPLIDHLDEPEKVTIPQEAADWIESVRSLSNSMSCLMTHDQIKRFSYELTLWCYESGSNDNLHKLARAWLDGYEVEKEPTWVVKLDDDFYVTEIFSGISRFEINTASEIDVTGAIEFTNKHFAEAVALLVEGIVEEVE